MEPGLRDSLGIKRYTDMLVEKYSRLFSLPSKVGLSLTLLAVCLIGSSVAILPFQGLAHVSEVLVLGVLAFVFLAVAELVAGKVILSRDPVFDVRRCLGASLFSSLIYFGFVGFGAALSLLFGNKDIVVRLSLIGASSTLAFRLLAFSWLSSSSNGRIASASFLQLLVCYGLTGLLARLLGVALTWRHLWLAALSAVLSTSALLTAIQLLRRVGRRLFGVDSLRISRAFFASWMANLNSPLESFLEEVGEEDDVEVSLLAFRNPSGQIKAVIAVPEIHPGPFRDLGSSNLPNELKWSLEEKLGCVAAVPHGLSGHELNLASRAECRRVVRRVCENLEFGRFSREATPFLRVEYRGAKVSCQVFGDCPLLTLTLAPMTMEDLPRSLKGFIVGEARRLGYLHAIPIDAHNSINGPFNTEKATHLFQSACVKALKESLKLPRMQPLVGVSCKYVKEFSLKDGMGPGGITALVVRVGEQTAAYVVIDGNNMIFGLRDKILRELKEIGIDDGEVLTTDTHVVGARASVDRGYHPVGEAMNHDVLLGYIRRAVSEALKDLEPCEVSWLSMPINGVKVLGEEQVKNLCVFSLQVVGMAKKLAVLLIPSVYLFLIAVSLL
ncbi:MAG TPA: DUF2070 family protein [Candidatus Bathyarchaeota archaeon]|nr:DUF2070 family protein [Candidatus Bathyarchaeota archaeon]